MNKAIFLDRDGTINPLVTLSDDPRNSPRNTQEFEFFPEAGGVIKMLNKAGWLVIIISNQPNVAKGKSTWLDVDSINRKMNILLGKQGAELDDIYYCYHRAEDNCACRKPKPGLLLQAAKDWNIDLSQSWMIGDSETDIQAGKAAGCKTLLVKGGVKVEDIHRLC